MPACVGYLGILGTATTVMSSNELAPTAVAPFLFRGERFRRTRLPRQWVAERWRML